ncbi:MAG: hypothetical protein ACR2NN_11970 [Bryobacteraceae bacterium]
MQIKIVLMTALLSLSALAAQKTWTGQITDSMCGASHAGMGDMGKNSTECIAACAKGGAKYAFVTEGKVYEIANQGLADLKNADGKTVRLTGDLASDGKTITVVKIAAR